VERNARVIADCLEAYAERGLDGMADYWDEQINWRAIEGAPDDVGEMQGPERVRRYFQEWVDMFEGITNVAEELIDLDDDRVLAVQRAGGRAKLSGAETEILFAVIYTIRDGKIVRGREYIDRGAAIAAARAEAEEGGVRPPTQNPSHW
jgi:ketosteroid isomerase-like protein